MKLRKWTRAFYQPNLPLYEGKYVTACKEHIELSKEAAAESMVLLKNNNQLLPLQTGSRVALFGKGSFDYVKGGGGSGDVTVSYVHNLYDGMKMQNDVVSIYEPLSDYYRHYVTGKYENGAAPGMIAEPELPDELVAGAAAYADTAIVAISRFSGEAWDRSRVEYNAEFNPWEHETSMPKIAAEIFDDGDFELTKSENEMLAKVTEKFDRIVVVINAGSSVDTSWFINNDKLSSVLMAWQAGMEGGVAAAEILCGKVSPSGKLTDTFAANLNDYPSTANFHESPHYVDYTDDIYVGYRYFETIPGAKEKVCYPFGYGLSYTKFTIIPQKTWMENDEIKIAVQVTNTGAIAGKEVVQVYYSAPQGLLKKPSRELCAFTKTRNLLPGESQLITLSFTKDSMASYDDLGKVAKSAYVLEKGVYEIFVGNSVRDAEKIDFVIELAENVIVKQLSSKLVPTSLKKRMLSDGTFETLPQSEPHNPDECVIEKMIPGYEEALTPRVRSRESYLLMKPYVEGATTLLDVAEGRATLEEFIAQLNDEQLINLLGGQPATTVSNTYGFGNLPEYGVPNIMTADGPAGLRIVPEIGVCTTAWPCATALASTWNTELVEKVGKAGAEEVKENNLCVWLTPAINIHRNPMCGRNFEYYSEDPFLTGKMGAAMVKGIQSQHIAASVKHFAANNKETNRKQSDSRVSERALREIYLKAFEIIVNEADPWTIMSSYNIINGYRASENHELLEDILRGEWGYKGMVTSDWWTRGEHYKEIKAGNDVKMACGFTDRVMEAMKKGALTREDLERSVKRVLELILKID